MSRKLYLTTLLIIALVTLQLSIHVVSAATLYVGSPASCGLPTVYPDVSTALSFASNGDTIKLCEDIQEEVTLLTINVDITIDGYYNGRINKWILNDTLDDDATLDIQSNIIIRDVNLTIFSSDVNDPQIFILGTGSSITVLDSILLGIFKTTTIKRLFRLTNAELGIYNSNITTTNKVPNGVSWIIYATNTNITVYGSSVTHMSDNGFILVINNFGSNSRVDVEYSSLYSERGRGASITSSFFTDQEINIKNSAIESNFYSINIQVDSSQLLLTIQKSNLTSKFDYALYIRAADSSIVNAVIFNSKLISTNGYGLYIYTVNSQLNLNVNPSIFIGGASGLYLSATNSVIDAYVSSTYIYSRNFNAIFLSSIFFSDYDIVFESVSVETDAGSGQHGIRVLLSDNVDFKMRLVDVNIYSRMAGIYITENYNIASDIVITDSSIVSNEDVGLYTRVSSSTLNIMFNNSYLDGQNIENVLEAFGSSTLNYTALYSDIGVFNVNDDPSSNVYMKLLETVYDEINSYEGGAQVYSRWTIAIKILSKIGLQPVVGALLEIYNASQLITQEYADQSGLVLFTFSYNYDSANPLIKNLMFNASYQRYSNSTSYTLFEPLLTTPSWFKTHTILLKFLVLKVNLAGHIGLGTLNVFGDTGTLVMGSWIPGGWINIYPVKIVSTSTVSNLFFMTYYVLYDGTWVKGYFFAYLDSGLVYTRFSGVEMYGKL